MNKMVGIVSKTLKTKKAGFIVLENSDEKYYFQANHSPNLHFENLKEGQKVLFVVGNESKIGDKFANDVEIFNEGDSDNSFHLIVEKKESFIEKLINTFVQIESCRNPNDFEDSVFVLLRCLGIHNLYQFDRKNQSGQADGFFILGNLAVIYDCTLRDNFEEYKDEQIRNYRNKLNNESQLTISVKRTDGGTMKKEMQISGKNRQVWIITKNHTREIGDFNGIKVKEVAIKDIIKILSTKLNSGIFEEEDLSARLTLIDRT